MNLAVLIIAAWVPTLVHPVKDPGTHQMLRDNLAAKDPVVVEEAQRALVAIHTGLVTNVLPVTPPLPAAVTEHPAVVLKRLTVTQMRMNPEQVLEHLSAPEIVVRDAAVAAAVRGRLTEAVPLMLPLLKDRDEVLRQNVCHALKQLAPAAEEPGVVPAIVRMLNREMSLRACEAAAQVLVGLHDRAAERALVALLNHDHELVRLAAARAVTSWDDLWLAPVLVPLLADTNDPVARAAAIGLGTLKNRYTARALRERLSDPAPDPVQEKIAWALGELRDESAVGSLMELVGTGADSVSAAAAEALGKIGDREAIPALQRPVNKVKPPMTSTRREAIKALRLLGDTDTMRGVWIVVTKRIIPTPMGPVHDATEVREEGLRYLAAVGEPRLAGSLIGLIDGDDADTLQPIMGEAFRTIGAYGDADTADELLRSLRTTPPAVSRPVLVEVLWNLTGRLYRALPDESYLRYSVESLGPPSSLTIPPPPGVELVD